MCVCVCVCACKCVSGCLIQTSRHSADPAGPPLSVQCASCGNEKPAVSLAEVLDVQEGKLAEWEKSIMLG